MCIIFIETNYVGSLLRNKETGRNCMGENQKRKLHCGTKKILWKEQTEK